MAESAIVERILRRLQLRGAWAFKTHGTVMGRRGIPDIVGAYRGRPIALEVKQPGKHPTPLQHYELQRAQRAGAWAQVVHSVDDAEHILNTIDQTEGDA